MIVTLSPGFETEIAARARVWFTDEDGAQLLKYVSFDSTQINAWAQWLLSDIWVPPTATTFVVVLESSRGTTSNFNNDGYHDGVSAHFLPGKGLVRCGGVRVLTGFCSDLSWRWQLFRARHVFD